MLWVCKIIFRHRSIRRIKNHTHTTYQSKVMDLNVKMTRKKNSIWGSTVSTKLTVRKLGDD